MAIFHYDHDLPASFIPSEMIAVDCEAMGLNHFRDRLCLIQLSNGDGNAHLVQFHSTYEAPNLKKVLTDPDVIKIFHFARFDVALLQQYLGVLTFPLYCTKIASKLVRTFSDRHGLRDLCKDLLNIEISKQQQSSDWGAEKLTEAQQHYAANDVLHLHALKTQLDKMLLREGRAELAKACFDFLPARAYLDLAGWAEEDIFQH